jgi:hypothetical protein
VGPRLHTLALQGAAAGARRHAHVEVSMASEMAQSQLPTLVLLGEDERIEVQARAVEASIIVTDRRLLVATDDALMVDIPFDRLRRIQFDIEKARPATLVVVPEWPSDPPQVLAVPPEQYIEVAQLLGAVGLHLNDE